MQAIILAAGVGTRIKPIAGNNPKALLEIDGKSFIDLRSSLKSRNLFQYLLSYLPPQKRGLNYLLIPKLGYSIAAVTTAFSYFLLMFLNYFTVRYLLQENVLYLRMFLFKFMFALMFFLVLSGIVAPIKGQFILSITKVFAVIAWGYFVFIKQIFLRGESINPLQH